SSLTALVNAHVTKNAETVGIAIAPLMVGSSCAAAITGIRNSPLLITSDVHTSGEVTPVNTDTTDSTTTSALSTSSVTPVLVAAAAREAGRNAHALQHPTTTM